MWRDQKRQCNQGLGLASASQLVHGELHCRTATLLDIVMWAAARVKLRRQVVEDNGLGSALYEIVCFY